MKKKKMKILLQRGIIQKLLSKKFEKCVQPVHSL